MRNKQIFLISFIIYLCTISSVRAGEYHLLPEPQKFTPLGSSFVLGRTKLSTPVLRQEWEAFVVDRGGVIDDKARASIEVKLVPSLADLSFKSIALFGCGDSESYCDTFCDGMGILYEDLKDSGCSFIGNKVGTDGYSFSSSIAVVNGTFVGLALDEVNESDKTAERIDNWTAELKKHI